MLPDTLDPYLLSDVANIVSSYVGTSSDYLDFFKPRMEWNFCHGNNEVYLSFGSFRLFEGQVNNMDEDMLLAVVLMHRYNSF